jgi:hypothetical protein
MPTSHPNNRRRTLLDVGKRAAGLDRDPRIKSVVVFTRRVASTPDDVD